MTRLLVVAHAATPCALVFGDTRDVDATSAIAPLGGRTAAWLAGPEPACLRTAVALGAGPERRDSRDDPTGSGRPGLVVASELAGPDFGRWRGRSLAEVGAEDPAGLQAWLHDPAAAPYGGESLTDLVARVGTWADARTWPEGRTVAVATPLVVRALAVHALGAPAAVILRLDVAPLGRVSMSRAANTWRLRLG